MARGHRGSGHRGSAFVSGVAGRTLATWHSAVQAEMQAATGLQCRPPRHEHATEATLFWRSFSRLLNSSRQLVAEQKCRESSLCPRRSAPEMQVRCRARALSQLAELLNVKLRSAVRRTRSASRVRRGASNGLRSSAGSWEALEDDVFGFESVMGRCGSRLRV